MNVKIVILKQITQLGQVVLRDAVATGAKIICICLTGHMTWDRTEYFIRVATGKSRSHRFLVDGLRKPGNNKKDVLPQIAPKRW